MAMKRITKRWILNSLVVILFILITAQILFAFGIRGYYYNSVKQILTSNVKSNITLLETYFQDSSVDLTTEVRNIVSNFNAKDIMELMVIDANGNIVLSSSGFNQSSKMYMPDFNDAMSSDSGYGEFQGNINGENVMAVTYIPSIIEENIAAMRVVTSLELVDQQIVRFIIILTIFCLAIIFFVAFSSSYFINSIVIPVGDISKTATKIAKGDFKVRLKKKRDDEIGDLCDVINHMAEELETSEKLKNDFISSVSHELRTPLTAIKGWGETLNSGDLDKETMQKGMGVILGETQRLSTMVEELLDFSRIQSGRMQLKMEKVDIIAELSDVVLMFTERAKRENIALIYAEREDIILITGDRDRLRQVFINVIDNALKYSNPNGTVTISTKYNQEYFVALVSDNGVGIDKEDLPKIKTKFFKGNTTRRGSGIGLAVADEIITLHGGAIDIRSEKGVGTTVTIVLPLKFNPPEQSV